MKSAKLFKKKKRKDLAL